MSPRCREIQELLAEHGPAVLRDRPEARDHVAECDDCFRLLEAFGELEPALAALPKLDAPDAVVEDLLARTVEPPPAPVERERGRRAPRARSRAFRLTGVAAASLASLLLVTVFMSRPLMFPAAVVDRDLDGLGAARQAAPEPGDPATREAPESRGQLAQSAAEARKRDSSVHWMRGGRVEPPEGPPAPARVAKLEEKQKDKWIGDAPDLGWRFMVSETSELNQRIAESESLRFNEADYYAAHASGDYGSETRSYAPTPQGLGKVQTAHRSAGSRVAEGGKKPAELGAAETVESGQLAGQLLREREFTLDDLEGSVGGEDATEGAADTAAADEFWRERRSLEGVSFQPAAGYWANTYVPGDPLLRWLEARMAARTTGAGDAAALARLDERARPTTQPFDPPVSSALGVFLHADRASSEGEGRMLVQVGLQGAVRHAGLRPGMNVALVLDARETASGEHAAAMRALTDALLAARETGDRFSLILAGRPESTAVSAESFRHGPLQVALLDLVEPPPAAAGHERVLSLTDALERAVATVSASDDPTAPLGSSLVLLATAQPLGPEASALEAIAHQSAVAGIPVSVAGIGERVAPDELERVALAGQGNRRLLESPADAERVVQRELSAQGRAIARAARLRIRLAPGVKLIDVIGSERLDGAGATRVRQAEQSIDRRLSRNLGIERDRGEDEEGIQIVVPTFYAGDAHVVLLDVVAPGPGPVADVTLRYKDLVYLRNGVARASLTLPASGPRTAEPGPLERNVIKNLLAIRLAERLETASELLRTGRDTLALSILNDARELRGGIARSPGYERDPDLRADLALLDGYLAALATPENVPRDYLAESLALSSYFKTVPRRPAE